MEKDEIIWNRITMMKCFSNVSKKCNNYEKILLTYRQDRFKYMYFL